MEFEYDFYGKVQERLQDEFGPGYTFYNANGIIIYWVDGQLKIMIKE